MSDQNPPLVVHSSPGSPGVSGAIKDAVDAVSRALAPKGITQRGLKVKQAIDADSGGSPQPAPLGESFDG